MCKPCSKLMKTKITNKEAIENFSVETKDFLFLLEQLINKCIEFFNPID